MNRNIHSFQPGDIITRTVPAKSHGDRSYIGDKIKLIAVTNNNIYYQILNNPVFNPLNERIISLKEWDEGWDYYPGYEPKSKKEIIGYKVPFDISNNGWKKGDIAKKYKLGTNTYYVEDKSGVFPEEIVEQWEPVYGEYKKGDWVYIVGSDGSYELPLNKMGDIVQIEEINYEERKISIQRNGKSCTNTPLNYIKRRATLEEIEAAQTIKIGDYPVEFKLDHININGDTYVLSELKDLKLLMERHQDQIKSLNVGCSGQYKVDLKLLNRIINKFEKQ